MTSWRLLIVAASALSALVVGLPWKAELPDMRLAGDYAAPWSPAS